MVTFGVSFGSFGAGMVSGAMLLEWAELAERLGYETLWYRDHVAWHSAVLDPFTTLGAMAARTSRLRLATGVLLAPLRPPALVAKAMATLDVISAGRAVLGVGIGGEFPKEFEVCGVPTAERGARTDEALEVIRRLWTTAPAHFEGRFHRFDGIVMEPRPVQAPHPPIWIGGRSDAALRRAATFGDGWLAYFVTPRRFRESVDKMGGPRGTGRAPIRAGLVLYACVSPSRAEGRAAAVQYLSTEYRQPFEDLVDRFCAVGPPEACVEAIQGFVDAGADHVAVIPTVPPARVPEQLQRIAEEVVPAFAAARP